MTSFFRKHGAWLGFLLLVAIFSLLTNGQFLLPRNASNLLRQTSINGILAAGMTMVILTGGIDLSIGSLVALTGVVVGISQVNWGWAQAGMIGAFGSALASVIAGGLVGFTIGGLVATLGIPPFVITLGMMVVARGIALILTDGSGISPMGDMLRPLGEGYLPPMLTYAVILFLGLCLLSQYRHKWKEIIFPALTFAGFAYAFISYRGFPILGLFLVAAIAGTAFLLSHTVLGRCIYSVGSNEQAAFWAGVPVQKVKWFVYTAMGLFSGLAGVLLTARLNSAVPTAGNLFELDAIASVVIGGTSLKGGSGMVTGSLIGALMIATLNNGMDLLQVSSFYQMVLKGGIIIIAVALDKGQRQR